jgi:thioredoxin 1
MPAFGSAPSGADAEVPVKGMVTLIAVCSEHCMPCKMMQPVMYKLEAEYKGRFALVCLDKDKNKELSEKFKARVTPTLVFCDKDGKEIYRHEGVMNKKSILDKLQKAGMQ